jgi:hypothetical protein
VERGRHEELLQQNGFYRNIYDLELRDQEEALYKVKRNQQEGLLEPASLDSGVVPG